MKRGCLSGPRSDTSGRRWHIPLPLRPGRQSSSGHRAHCPPPAHALKTQPPHHGSASRVTQAQEELSAQPAWPSGAGSQHPHWACRPHPPKPPCGCHTGQGQRQHGQAKTSRLCWPTITARPRVPDGTPICYTAPGSVSGTARNGDWEPDLKKGPCRQMGECWWGLIFLTQSI